MARSRCHMGTFLKHKRLKFTFFIGPTFQVFAIWEFTTKEDLNSRKQVLLLHLRLWPALRPKIWSIFKGEIYKKSLLCKS